MGALALKCPSTGLDISAVIATDDAGLKKFPNTVTKAVCPHCGRTHSWWTREARLIEGMPPAQWRATLGRAS